MNPCLCIVFAASVAAAPVPVAPASEFERLERGMQQLVEQERFDELARDGEAAFGRLDLAPWQRRELAFYAVRGYHRTFAATGQAAGLCRARNLLRRVEREVGLGDDAAIAARLREVTEDGLRRQGPKDPCVPVKARVPSGVPTSTPAQLLPVERSAPPAPPVADPQPVLIDISNPRRPHAPRPPRPVAAAPRDDVQNLPPAPLPGDPEPRERPRERVVAGSLLLLVSAGLGAGMAAVLLHRSDVNGQIVLLGERARAEGRKPTAAEFDDIARLADTYRDLTPIAGITGAVAGAAAIAGVVLLAAPQRRRTTARLSASPWSAMLSLSGRF